MDNTDLVIDETLATGIYIFAFLRPQRSYDARLAVALTDIDGSDSRLCIHEHADQDYSFDFTIYYHSLPLHKHARQLLLKSSCRTSSLSSALLTRMAIFDGCAADAGTPLAPRTCVLSYYLVHGQQMSYKLAYFAVR